jgi:hypothetical protein
MLLATMTKAIRSRRIPVVLCFAAGCYGGCSDAFVLDERLLEPSRLDGSVDVGAFPDRSSPADRGAMSHPDGILESTIDARIPDRSADTAAPDRIDTDAGLPDVRGGCMTDHDCVWMFDGGLFPSCAMAHCNPVFHLCSFSAVDEDGDGHRIARCVVPGWPIELGDDCDDNDPLIYPGKPRNCSDVAGKKVEWPGGVPRGTCAYGSQSCKADGTIDACVGVKAPSAKDCRSNQDNDCDGIPDNGQCICVLNTTRKCFTAPPPAKDGVGRCRPGTEVCVEDPGNPRLTTWGACVDQILPLAVDSCDAGNDDNCDGIVNNGAIPNPICKCPNQKKDTCANVYGAKGTCATGTATCTNGAWSKCSVLPAGSDQCKTDNDDSCDGVAHDGCECLIDIDKPKECEPCHKVTTTCVAGKWSTCAGDVPTNYGQKCGECDGTITCSGQCSNLGDPKNCVSGHCGLGCNGDCACSSNLECSNGLCVTPPPPPPPTCEPPYVLCDCCGSVSCSGAEACDRCPCIK